jgi:hypothetical protein
MAISKGALPLILYNKGERQSHNDHHGGVTKQQITHSPAFVKLRLQQKEWNGCAKCALIC